MTLSLALLNDFLNDQRDSHIYLGFSGGLDSTVLLHLLAHTSFIKPYQVTGIHINHGLSPNAIEWQQQCQQLATSYGFDFISHTLSLSKQPGESLEHIARIARYQCFTEHVTKNDILLTAHHQNDQAETLLLQLIRGAGPKGLAAMPEVTSFHEGWHLRPLLTNSRQQLEKYAIAKKLTWVDDESNTDLKFDRNYIRAEILPLLQQRWPAVTKTLSRSAALCAEATIQLETQATTDWKAVSRNKRIDLKQLQRLPVSRQQQVLRYAITMQELPLCGFEKINEILAVMFHAQTDAMPLVTWPGGEARRYQNSLYLSAPIESITVEDKLECTVGEAQTLTRRDTLAWQVVPGGLNLKKGTKLTVHFRQGGERFHPQGRVGSHPLKKLMQEWGIPPWLRGRVPLLYKDDELVAVIDYGLSHQHCSEISQDGWLPQITQHNSEH